jgi:hypothetical protein
LHKGIEVETAPERNHFAEDFGDVFETVSFKKIRLWVLFPTNSFFTAGAFGASESTARAELWRSDGVAIGQLGDT